MNKSATTAAGLAFVALAIPAFVLGQTYISDVGIEKDDVKIGAKEYSPYLNRAHPDRVLWGDTHLHTSYSTDAGMIGNFLGPDEAFRFARGEIVRASAGQCVRTSLRTATQAACQWAAISRTLRMGKRRPSWFAHCVTPMVRTSIGFKSSKADSTATVM